MRLSVTGWTRNMGPNFIGNPDVESAIPHGPSRDVTALKKRGDEILISWYSKYITLTGKYRVELHLSKDDIAILFKEYFGEHLSLADLESNGLFLTNEGLKEKLLGMTVGELLDMTRNGNEPSPVQEFTADPQPKTSRAANRVHLT